MENAWHYRDRKGTGEISLTEVEVIKTGTSGIWFLFLAFLQPLCIPEKPFHPPCLLQGGSGACFFCKVLWDLLLKKLVIILWSYQGSGIFLITGMSQVLSSSVSTWRQTWHNVLPSDCLAEHRSELSLSAGPVTCATVCKCRVSPPASGALVFLGGKQMGGGGRSGQWYC